MFNPWYSNYLKSYDMSMLISEYTYTQTRSPDSLQVYSEEI